MSETAPFTPSPGIPNEAHARFYAELPKWGGPSAPAQSAPRFQTSATIQHIAKMAEQHVKANPAPAAPASTAPTAESIRAYQQNRGKPQSAPSVVLDGGPDQLARIDAELRAEGLQTGTDTTAAKERLIQLKRSTPLDKQTTQWRRDWEAKYAAADAAGETPAALVALGSADRVERAVDVLDKAIDSTGHAPVSAFSPSVLHGYSLPQFVEGQTYNAEELLPQLAAARKAGISQAQVNAFIRADMKARGFRV